MSPKVQAKDAQVAEEILRFALFKEVVKREKRKKRKLNTGVAAVAGDGDSEGEDEDAEGSEEEEEAPPQRMADKSKQAPAPQPPVAGSPTQDTEMTEGDTTVVAGSTEDGGIRKERYAIMSFRIDLCPNCLMTTNIDYNFSAQDSRSSSLQRCKMTKWSSFPSWSRC